jgi:hypothetical protein
MSGTVSTGSADPRLTSYLDEVATHLAGAPGLSEPERRELLDDLATHLAEVAAEDEGGTLEERLGTPSAYARELLASAGVDVTGTGPRRRSRTVAGARRLVDRPLAAARAAGLADRPWARAVVAVTPDLAPVWWALRGYLLADLVAGVTEGFAFPGFPVPRVFGTVVLGLPVTAALVVLSLREGRRAQTAGPPSRRRVLAGRLVTALCLVVGLLLVSRLSDADHRDARYAGSSGTPEQVTNLCLTRPGGGIVANVFPYDREGRPLDDVLLYDQAGRPIEIGDRCSYGDTAAVVDQDGYPVDNAYPRPPAVPPRSSGRRPGAVDPQRPPLTAVPRLPVPTTPPPASTAPSSTAASTAPPPTTGPAPAPPAPEATPPTTGG